MTGPRSPLDVRPGILRAVLDGLAERDAAAEDRARLAAATGAACE